MRNVKRTILVVLMSYIAFFAPWRLMWLVANVAVAKSGLTRVSDRTDKYWETRDLERVLTHNNWKVHYVPSVVLMIVSGMPGVELYGLTDTKTRDIYIADELSWNGRYATLAHEGGHAFATGALDEAEEEGFAEAVAFLVCHDGAKEHARYLAPIKLKAALAIIAYWPEIYAAADRLEW